MARTTRPQAEAIVGEFPDAAAQGLGRARFLLEIKAGINLLGGIGAGEGSALLERLSEAHHPLLGRFAADRRTAR
jgi:hypothetical protein